MSISSALLMPRLSVPSPDCGGVKENFEQEVMGHLIGDNTSKAGQGEAAKEQTETYIVESTDNVELYFVWPIPLVFDEFTLD